MSALRRIGSSAWASAPHALRSLKNKVALLFFAITLLAFGAIFFYVVPALQSNLEEQTLQSLEREATGSSGQLERVMGSDVEVGELDERVREAADVADARVTLLGVQRSGDRPGGFYVISDSRVGIRIDVSYGVAERAVQEEKIVTGLGRDSGDRVAQAGAPLRSRAREAEWVALYSRSLDDVTEAVGLIRTQVLVAGAIALLVSLAGGYLIARALARRVRRLEGAAREVAVGRFIDPLPIDSDDELGALTRAFNEMTDQLVRVDRARREFIANASHELRTPIFSLGGFVELLQDEELDDATREEFLRTMREQVDRLQKLAVDLLDLSRLDAGSLDLHPEEVDLSALTRAVASEFRPAVDRHRSELRLHVPDGRVEAFCDPERVTQIMRILLDNALRHTPEGTQVTVTAGRRNGAAELTVADTGPGLDAASADQLFERFYTADAARGSGLGLAIARELAEHMQGRIRLDAEPGETCFTLTLPLQGNGGGA